MIEHLLENAGLTKNEATIYLTLAKHKALTYNQIAELSNLNRTTCYGVVKRLIEYGLAKEDLGQPIMKLLPQSLSNLVSYLGREQAQVLKKVELAKRATEEITKLIPHGQFTEPRIVFIDEKGVRDFLYKRSEAWDKSILNLGGVVWGFQSARFERDFKDWIEWLWRKRAHKDIQIKFFSDQPQESNPGINQADKTEIRYSHIVNYNTNIWIIGDYTVLASLEEVPNYIIEIYEPLISKNFREFFKAMWQATEQKTNAS